MRRQTFTSRAFRHIRSWPVVVAATGALLLPAPAAASTFTAPNKVAAAMERHYNGAGYKSRLAKANARLTSRVLCAYDGVIAVECTARMLVTGKRVRAEWQLVKATRTRAKLTWTVTGPGVFDVDSEIVAPAMLGLTGF